MDIDKINSDYMFLSLQERTALHRNSIKKFNISDIAFIPENVSKLVTRFKELIYTKDYESVANNSMSIMTGLRRLVLLGGSFSLSPVLVIPTFIVDAIIENKVNDKKVDSVIKNYISCMDKLDKEIEKAEDPDIIKNLKALRSETENGLDNLKTYRKNIAHPKDDISKRPDYKKKTKSSSNGGFSSYDFDDDFDDDFDFDESFGESMRLIPVNDLLVLSLCLRESEDESLIELAKFIDKKDIATRLMSLDEGTIKRIGAKKRKIVKKASRNYNKAAKTTADTIDAPLNIAYKTIKAEVIGATREEIINGKSFKISRLLKQGLMVYAIGSVAPILGLVTLLTSLALRKNMKKAEKERILRSLKSELDIVEEKLRDADSEGNKRAKYELMRIRAKMKADIDKIRYNIETHNEEDYE